MVHGIDPGPPTSICLGSCKNAKRAWGLWRNGVVPGGQLKWPLIFDDRHQIIPSFGSAEYSYVHHFVQVFLRDHYGLAESEVYLRVRFI
jgi:hypothetical protein